MFRKKHQSVQVIQSPKIRLVGDRAAGKTTYITTLASWPCDDPDSPVKTVVPIGEDTKNLINTAKECLEQQQEIVPNDYGDGIEKSYILKIEFKDKFTWLNSQLATLEIECKDYPGEFFSDLLEKQNPPLLRQYIEDCKEVTGILFLLDGTSRKDKVYADCLYEFLVQLDQFSSRSIKTRRVAVALTKCELSELWLHRLNPREKVMARFEDVHRRLENLRSITVDYFATSAFGILGSVYPTPNSKIVKRDDNGTRAIIKEPNPGLWQPFGLVDPIYWLCTGNRHPDFSRDKG